MYIYISFSLYHLLFSVLQKKKKNPLRRINISMARRELLRGRGSPISLAHHLNADLFCLFVGGGGRSGEWPNPSGYGPEFQRKIKTNTGPYRSIQVWAEFITFCKLKKKFLSRFGNKVICMSFNVHVSNLKSIKLEMPDCVHGDEGSICAKWFFGNDLVNNHNFHHNISIFGH